MAERQTGFFPTWFGAGPIEADNLFKGKKRRFHQCPRVTTLNLEAGYMHAVFPSPPEAFRCNRGRVHICTESAEDP